jgi:hypothetical protein
MVRLPKSQLGWCVARVNTSVRLPLVMMTMEPGNKFSRPAGMPEIYDTAGSLSVMNVRTGGALSPMLEST